MLKSLLRRAGVGFLIGMVVGNLIALLSGSSSAGELHLFSQQLFKLSGGNVITATILQTLCSGLYGALCFGGTVLYDVDSLPLAAATALHCGVIVLFYIPIALLLGWVANPLELLIIISIQIVVFFMIWLIMYAIFRKQVRELNALQEQMKQKQEEEEA